MTLSKKAEKPAAAKAPKEVVAKALSIEEYSILGDKTAPVAVSADLFGKKDISDKLIAQYIRVYAVNQRQGNASTKTRAEVAGTTKKVYKQKGTGRARHGSMKAPIYVGGGVVGGPKPKNYQLHINKKQRTLVLTAVLTKQLAAKNVIALSDDALQIKPKSKIVAKFLKTVEFGGKKTLFVLPKMDDNNFRLAARNIEGVSLSDIGSLNPYILMNAQKIVFVTKALGMLEGHFLKKE